MPFLDRFGYGQEPIDADPVVASVVTNLRHILNTKRFYGSVLPTFGIDDLSHCTSRDVLVHRLIDLVTESIENFETRVELLKIEPRPQTTPMRVSLLLVCRIKGSKREFDLSFDTTGSRVIVRSEI